MGNILSSASKVVLLYVVGILGAVAAFAAVWGVVYSTLDPKELVNQFGTAVTFVLGFYFGRKEDSATTANTDKMI